MHRAYSETLPSREICFVVIGFVLFATTTATNHRENGLLPANAFLFLSSISFFSSFASHSSQLAPVSLTLSRAPVDKREPRCRSLRPLLSLCRRFTFFQSLLELFLWEIRGTPGHLLSSEHRSTFLRSLKTRGAGLWNLRHASRPSRRNLINLTHRSAANQAPNAWSRSRHSSAFMRSQGRCCNCSVIL